MHKEADALRRQVIQTFKCSNIQHSTFIGNIHWYKAQITNGHSDVQIKHSSVISDTPITHSSDIQWWCMQRTSIWMTLFEAPSVWTFRHADQTFTGRSTHKEGLIIICVYPWNHSYHTLLSPLSLSNPHSFRSCHETLKYPSSEYSKFQKRQGAAVTGSGAVECNGRFKFRIHFACWHHVWMAQSEVGAYI
jgi:hypothetical protein